MKTIASRVLAISVALCAFAVKPAAAESFKDDVRPSPFAGTYIGASIGVAHGKYNGIIDTSEADIAFSEVLDNETDTTFAVGGYIGRNWVSSGYLIGIEADFAYLGQSARGIEEAAPDRDFFDLDVNWVASLKGRFGIVRGNLALYTVSGFALADAKVTSFNDQTTFDPERGSKSFTSFGYLVGAGTEYAFSDRAIFRIEGLYHHFFNGVTFTDDELSEDTDDGDFVDIKHLITVRAGLAWKF